MLENLQEVEDYQNRKVQEDAAESSGKGTAVTGFDKTISFKDITYRYPTGKKDVLSKASFEIYKGKSVGIVGMSGAGKTTVMDILLGLLKPQKGRVMVDEADIRADLKQWLAQVGYIPQSIFLLDGNVKENVAFGVPEHEIEESRLWAALKEAAIDEDIRRLPEQLDTQLGERGIRLSGGQRQRIGIARALYTNPSVLFFDEATSALDNDTEAAIMDSIDKLHGSKTMIIIAHRLTTIAGCDHIFRVEKGKVTKER